MSKGLKITTIVIVVIAVVTVVLALAVRSIMTSARVRGIIVERIEKRVGADIDVGGVSTSFPFGMDIDLRDVGFRKVDRKGKSIEFASDVVAVHPSIISIIRKKPELSSFVVKNGIVLYSSPKSNMRLIGLDLTGSLGLDENGKGRSVFSMKADSMTIDKSPVSVIDVEVAGSFADRKDLLTMSRIGFGIAGGRAGGSGSVGISKEGNLKVSTNMLVVGMKSMELAKIFPSIAVVFDGLFDVEAKSTFVVDDEGEVVLPSIDSNGNVHSSGGEMDVSSALSELERLAPEIYSFLKRASYDDFSMDFTIKKGWVKTQDWQITSSKGDWLVRGGFSLRGLLDYSARLTIPPDVQKGMDTGKYGDVLNLLKDKNGNLVLDFQIRGDMKRPRVSLDLENVKVKAAGDLFENIMKNF